MPFLSTPCRHGALAANPGVQTGRATLLPYLALLQAGFSRPPCCQDAGALLPHHFTLALPSRLRERKGGLFLLHFPSARAAQALPGALPGGVRTFLPSEEGRQPSLLTRPQRTPPSRAEPVIRRRPLGDGERSSRLRDRLAGNQCARQPTLHSVPQHGGGLLYGPATGEEHPGRSGASARKPSTASPRMTFR